MFDTAAQALMSNNFNVLSLEKPDQMDINDAFKLLVNDAYLWGKTGLTPGRRYYFRHNLRKDKNISLDKKLELLRKAGFEVEFRFRMKGLIAI